MGKKQTTTQTNTYGSPAPFSSPATVALQGMVKQGSDPSIPYAYAQRREDTQNSWKNPLGAYSSAASVDAANRVAGDRGSMDEANAIQTSNFNANNAAFNRQMGVVGATQPFQTGGTQVSKQPFSWGSLIGPAAAKGQAAMSGGGGGG